MLTILTIKNSLFTKAERSVIELNIVITNLVPPIELWTDLCAIISQIMNLFINHVEIHFTFLFDSCLFCDLFSSWKACFFFD